MEWEANVVPTITRSAIEWMQDQLESKEEQISELEEELAEALEELEAAKIHILRLISDRSLVD